MAIFSFRLLKCFGLVEWSANKLQNGKTLIFDLFLIFDLDDSTKQIMISYISVILKLLCHDDILRILCHDDILRISCHDAKSLDLIFPSKLSTTLAAIEVQK